MSDSDADDAAHRRTPPEVPDPSNAPDSPDPSNAPDSPDSPDVTGGVPEAAHAAAPVPAGQPDPEPAEPARRGRRRVVRWTAGVLAVLLLAAGGTGVALYEKLQGNIHKEHVEDQLGTDRPVKLNKSMNILLLGSDSRDGENRHYWSPDISGERSDTTILLHLSPNRDHAVAVSFPRDSMVRVPDCEKKNGQRVPAFFGMINAAFAYAGAPCTWKTIESTTDIHVDHYVKIDFTGFKRVVDALGGVEICVPHAVNDPRAELSLKAGRQVVRGDEALGYVRTRYGLGDGSDLERIQRQQKFMASVVKKATAGSMLTDPARTYGFLDAVTKSIATDDKLSVSVMRKLATSMKGISAGTVRFVTVPTQTYPKDPNRVQWDMAQAKPLFDAIRKDDALPAPKPEPNRQPQPKPENVRVSVVNAPKQVVQQLKGQRFRVTANRGPAQPETKILYGPGAERQADALAVVVPGVRIVPDPSVAPGTVALVTGPGGVRVQAPDIPKVHGEIKADQSVCA
jgi:LCP family protein required for cell wall assembly